MYPPAPGDSIFYPPGHPFFPQGGYLPVPHVPEDLPGHPHYPHSSSSMGPIQPP
jgi:hypothetical protein